MFDIDDIIDHKVNGQCLRKNGYTRRKYAEERADCTSKKAGKRCRVYKCPHCGLWHVTSFKHKDRPD